jgi:single-strand DNA-binding protein
MSRIGVSLRSRVGTPPSVIRLGQNTDCKRPRLKKSIHVARKASFMSRCVNTVTLLGNCGKDPDIRYTPSGKPVAKLSLAINENYKDNQGNWQERTHWISVVAWQRLAEVVGDYVQQGTKLYVHGRLNTESWEDRRSGEKRYRMSVVAEKLIVLSNGRQGAGNGRDSQSGPDRAETTNASTEAVDEQIPF